MTVKYKYRKFTDFRNRHMLWLLPSCALETNTEVLAFFKTQPCKSYQNTKKFQEVNI